MNREVVTKFYVVGNNPDPNNEGSIEVDLCAVTGDTHPDDHAFWTSTPAGDIGLGLINADLSEFFAVGATFEVTFRRVASPE